jgi:hypothetical protein
MTDNLNTPTMHDVLKGAPAIENYLAEIGFPGEDAYYLHRTKRWPIGKYGKYLIATKSNLARHARKFTAA